MFRTLSACAAVALLIVLVACASPPQGQRSNSASPVTPANPDEIDADGLVLLKSSIKCTGTDLGGEITGTVINRRGRKLSYVQISFNIYDASGGQVGSAHANVNGREPDRRWNFKAHYFGGAFKSYKFDELSGF